MEIPTWRPAASCQQPTPCERTVLVAFRWSQLWWTPWLMLPQKPESAGQNQPAQPFPNFWTTETMRLKPLKAEGWFMTQHYTAVTMPVRETPIHVDGVYNWCWLVHLHSLTYALIITENVFCPSHSAWWWNSGKNEVSCDGEARNLGSGGLGGWSQTVNASHRCHFNTPALILHVPFLPVFWVYQLWLWLQWLKRMLISYCRMTVFGFNKSDQYHQLPL